MKRFLLLVLIAGCSSTPLRDHWTVGPFGYWYYVPNDDGMVCGEIKDIDGDYWVEKPQMAEFLDPVKAQIKAEEWCAKEASK